MVSTKKLLTLKLLFYFLLITASAFPALASVSISSAKWEKAEKLIEKTDFDQAIALLLPGVQNNDAHALFLSGFIYLSTGYSDHDTATGVDLLERAMVQGYAPAIDELAGVYLAGDGVEKDEEKALAYYTRAAGSGYGPSQFNCGIMYKDGLGVPKNPVRAYLYLCLASLNKQDLNDVTQNAAFYRDEVARLLSPTQRQEILRKVNALTLPTQ